MRKRETVIERLDRFVKTWLSNPVAQEEFVDLIREAHEYPSSDHADEDLYEWMETPRP